MKALKLFSLFLILILTNSCTIDNKEVDTPTLFGTWNLVEVSGSTPGIKQNIEFGLVTWDFASQSIVVKNNNTNENLIDKFKTGTYPYTIGSATVDPFSCKETISFSANDINCIQFDHTNLFITQNTSDGITFKFIR